MTEQLLPYRTGWARVFATGILCVLTACSSGGPERSAIRMIDEFQPEKVTGTPVQVETPEPLASWDFKGEAPGRLPEKTASTWGWTGLAGIRGLKIDGGMLSGRATTEIPILAVRRTGDLDEATELHAVEIRMKASQGKNLSVGSSGTEPKEEQVLERFEERPWTDSTPLLSDGEFHTYTITIANFQLAAEWLMIRPTDEKGGTFDIESVRMISRKEHLAQVPSGVGWQGLSGIFLETLVARSPEEVRFEFDVPESAWLDLHVGTMEHPAVTFEVSVDAGSEPVRLLKRTVTVRQRWEETPLDLSEYVGQRVGLRFKLSAEKPGTIGFWGAPTVRSRSGRAPAPEESAIAKQLAEAGTPAPQGVILIMADTLRSDHLDAYGYSRNTAPRLSRLAARGTLFRDTVSQATWTKVSTPSIMTSLYPTSHRITDFVDRLPAAAVTMAEVFREAGYATVSYSSVPFSGAMTNLHQGFEELHERTSVTNAELDRESKTARVYVDRLSEWLSTHKDGPFFAFLHVFDPHDPYEPYQPYSAVWADPALKGEHEKNLEELKKHIEDPLMKRFGMGTREEFKAAGMDPEEFIARDQDWYDGSIRGLDAEIDRLLERLEELGIRDNTLLVFTSDHGEEFLEHDRMFHGQTVYGELTNVPLIFQYDKGVPSELVIDETVRSIDIMPTILELSHLARPEGLQGQSLVPLMAAVRAVNAAGGDLKAMAEGFGWTPASAVTEKAKVGGVMAPPPRDTESFGMVLDGWKLVQNTAGPGNEFELYSHREDPLNLNDVASQHPDVVQRLAAELEKWREMVLANQLPETDSTEGLSQEELQRLRSLGYIQ